MLEETPKWTRKDRRFDNLLSAGIVFIFVWIGMLIVAEFMPPAWEQEILPMLAYAALLFCLVALASAVWYIGRYVWELEGSGYAWAGAVVLVTAGAFATLRFLLGPELAATIIAFPFAILLPAILVRAVDAPVTRFGAAFRGALIAAVGAFCYLCLYCLTIGIKPSYLFGGIGPGMPSFIRNLSMIGVTVVMSCFIVWPIALLLLAGAAGGSIALFFRNRELRSAPCRNVENH